jgi:hypothetical protein
MDIDLDIPALPPQQPLQKPCVCGSLTHRTRSSKLCPLHIKRKRDQEAPVLPPGVREVMVTTTIGFNTLLREELIRPVILDAVHRCTDLYSEASRIFNGYLICLMEGGFTAPTISQSFIRRCFLVAKAQRGDAQQHVATSDATVNAYVDTVYSAFRPPGLAWTDGRGLSNLITNMAKAYLVNCQNHLVVNFECKFRIWIGFKICRHVGLLVNFNGAYLDQIQLYVMSYLLPRPYQGPVNFPPAVLGWLEQWNDPHHEVLLFRAVNFVLDKAHQLLVHEDNALVLSDEGIKLSWNQYIRPFWRILRTFVKHSDTFEMRVARRHGGGLRLFSLAPIASNKAHYISVDTNALHDLLRTVDGLAAQVPSNVGVFRENAMDWWTRMFHLNKVTSANRRFAYSLETNGMGVSVHLLKPKVDAEVNEYGFTYTNPSVYVPLEIGPADIVDAPRVVALDPGRRELYVGVSRAHTHGNDQIWEEGDEEEDVIRCSNARWQEISGSRYASKKGTTWLKGNANINVLVRNMPTPRCCSTEAYSLHLALFLANRDQLLGFYREMKWRRLRWKTRIKRQKAYDTLCSEISNGDSNAVIIYGNGSFSSSSRGHASAPKKGLFIELRRRYRNTRLVSEYLTSQVCSNCEGQLDVTRHWGLKKCNTICLTLWNRDVNAARNIRHKFLYRNNNNAEYPEAFRRG